MIIKVGIKDLDKYFIDDDDKEQLLFSILKELGRSDFRKDYRINLNKRIVDTYGSDAHKDLYHILIDRGLIEQTSGERVYKTTNKGALCLKRGYVFKDIKWYNKPKYAIYISIAALAISILNGSALYDFVNWIIGKSEQLYQVVEKAIL